MTRRARRGDQAARAVFVEDAEQLAKVRAVEADLPALEFVIVIEPAEANGGVFRVRHP